MRGVLLIILLVPLLAQAAIRLEVRGVDDPLRQAVVDAVELSQYGKREVSEAQAQRLYARAERQVRKALEPYGYFSARVSGELRAEGADWRAVLEVDAGAPVRVEAVHLDLDDSAAAQLGPVRRAVHAFGPRVGEMLDQPRYETGRDAISSALAASGYLDARLVTHRVEVHRGERRATIRLAWEVGPRYRFGAVRFTGSQFHPGFLERYVPFERGDWFSQDRLLALQQSLTGADYFAVVNVLPRVEEAHDGEVDIAVELAPAPRSIYTGGPFIGSDVGPGLRGGVERRWVNRRGHKWKNEIIIAQRLKSVSTWYTMPMPGRHQRSWNVGGMYRDIDTRTSQSRTLELVGNESRQWHGWTRTLGAHVLSGTFTVGRRGNEPRDTPGVEHGRSTMVLAEASLLKKRVDNPAFVRRGWLLELSARTTIGELLSDTRYTQVLADAKWIRGIGRRNRLIVRGTAGRSSVGDFSKLPAVLRFFAGGAQSVRGYGFQAIGPRNPESRVMGGRNLLVASGELEHYFSRSWGMAAFVDAGNAYNGSDFRPRLGAGLGLRWNSPVGMVRLDFAVPVRTEHHSALHLHLVLGPDL